MQHGVVGREGRGEGSVGLCRKALEPQRGEGMPQAEMPQDAVSRPVWVLAAQLWARWACFQSVTGQLGGGGAQHRERGLQHAARPPARSETTGMVLLFSLPGPLSLLLKTCI